MRMALEIYPGAMGFMHVFLSHAEPVGIGVGFVECDPKSVGTRVAAAAFDFNELRKVGLAGGADAFLGGR